MPEVAYSEQVKEKLAARDRARRDYFYLANDVLGYDFCPDTHAELFACFLQFDPTKNWAEQSTVKDRLILWSRGHFKTTAIVVAIVMAILNFPNIRILLMQGSITVTKTLLKQVFAHFTGEAYGSRLMELFPEFCGDKKALQGSAMQFTTTARTQKQLAQATVTVASPKAVKTGQHYELFFGDDLVNESNYRIPKQLEKVREDFTNVRPLMDPGAYFFVSGTRWAFGDLYEEILRWQAKSGKWLVSIRDCWTDASAKLPDAQKIPRFPQFKKKNGEMGGFTREQLLQLQTDGPSFFACQYLLRPIHTSQQAFTHELLDGACVPAADAPPLSQAILVIDVASSENATADDSVIAAGKIDMLGCAWMCDLRGDQWLPNELALNVIAMVLKHRPAKVLLEKSAAGMIFKSFLELMARQKNIFIPLDFIPVDNKPDAKNMRVVSLAGTMKRGRFKFFAGLSKFDRLKEQAVQFPKGKHGHDDYIDTAALLQIELAKEMMSLPIRKPIKDPILAMMQNAQEFDVQQMMQDAPQIDTNDMTGLD